MSAGPARRAAIGHAARVAAGLLALVGVGACQVGDQPPLVGIYTLDDQRLTGETTAFVRNAGFGDMTVLTTIDATGKVIAAKAIGNHQDRDPEPALALVRRWTFRPQTFEGRPVRAIGRVSVAYREPPIPPDASIAFPAGPLSEVAITLRRTACFGSCPDYRVTIRGDGAVAFDTIVYPGENAAAGVHLAYNGHNVLLPGHHAARIDPAVVARLVARFRAAHFFGLRDRYAFPATDNSTQVLTVRVGRAAKTVTDYIGTQAGMPQVVRDLQDAVDTVAGTARWVSGDARTLADLDAAGFDYRSPAGARLAVAAAWKLDEYRPAPGTEPLLLGLIDRGVPLDAAAGKERVGATLLRVAARQGHEALFDRLVARRVLAATPRSTLTEAFTQVGCSARIARALVAAGADPHAVGTNGTALTNLRGSAAACEDRPERTLGVARTLIALGVPLEARDDLGWTALMGCDSPALARLLLVHGADPNARTDDGTTPVLATDDDRVALILLRAGADPRARNDGGDVRASAVRGPWPATLAWLDARGIR